MSGKLSAFSRCDVTALCSDPLTGLAWQLYFHAISISLRSPATHGQSIAVGANTASAGRHHWRRVAAWCLRGATVGAHRTGSATAARDSCDAGANPIANPNLARDGLLFGGYLRY